jgi:hypothetical protein
MSLDTPSTPATESEASEKEPWTPPILKKMDIEETAFGGNAAPDGDGNS